MASLFGFGPSAKLEITLDDQEGRQTYLAKSHEKPAGEALPIYSGDDKVSGKVKVILPPGKKLEHLGIMVELRGVTELYYDRSQSEDFVSLVQELEAGAGTLTSTKEYEFSFDSVDKPHESYNGNNVRVRYYVIGRGQRIAL